MFISPADLTALYLTIKLASITTCLLLVVGTPLAWWLAHTQWRLKFIVESFVALPLVLPPTVLGFYLLTLLSKQSPVSPLWNFFNLDALAFTFEGLVIGSLVYSLPFVVQPLQNAFQAIGKKPLEVAATLGASPIDRFFSIALPLSFPGYLTATILGFAHTLGEFGIVLMIGGNIPGKTQVVSISIYEHVESINYAAAHSLSLILLLISFLLMLIIYGINHQFNHKDKAESTL